MAISTKNIPHTGRRKEASARVIVKPGKGNITINDRTLDDYFPRSDHRAEVLKSLEVTSMKDLTDVVATVEGGGITAQAQAIKLGIARALSTMNADFKPNLKREGLLSRDPRSVERKKYGQPGARKRFQHSKR
ncbi:TPA: 30S ribosomal protein S9 [bacterium]|nr:MAG: 30S ribosomal protein S9 [Candidatus Hydrogenedentes bacterium CG1_02_42_14]PIU47500.1 MAG: 30S ribosomal protein S9 [Candidatus Hydrogenedentes bacterium CG07_land_8_20_14_0_80_42_17]HBW47791.1 30S ribosomal protein S9 [bacterium]